MQKVTLSQTGDIADVIRRIGKEWMLLTAGTPDRLGTMTASWGGFGELWHRPMATIYVRPERHTYQFVEAEDTFSLAFFAPEHREALTFCGKHSGRDVDKVAECGFTIAQSETGGICFKEANLVLVCQKRYRAILEPDQMTGFDPNQYYGSHGGIHVMYMGEIVETYM
ncbi:MAG: flavin reductase [Oscillospiraceae bacterium]|nr:flavin reductase [Oscillospiraceae bacterium]